MNTSETITKCQVLFSQKKKKKKKKIRSIWQICLQIINILNSVKSCKPWLLPLYGNKSPVTWKKTLNHYVRYAFAYIDLGLYLFHWIFWLSLLYVTPKNVNKQNFDFFFYPVKIGFDNSWSCRLSSVCLTEMSLMSNHNFVIMLLTSMYIFLDSSLKLWDFL